MRPELVEVDTVGRMVPVRSGPSAPPKLCIDGVCFDNVDRATALRTIRGFLEAGQRQVSFVVNFVNVHSIALARTDRRLVEALEASDLVLPDGSGLAFAGRVRRVPVTENLNGTDFVPQVIAEAERSGYSVYLLGARREIIDACRRRLEVLHPGLRIVGSRHGHFTEEEIGEIVEGIRTARPDILLVGMGSPVQETWIERYGKHLGSRVCFGVGGLFDFLSGETPRAPRWMRQVGLEWVYRFMHNPAAKWERVLIEIPVFALRTLVGRVSVTAVNGDQRRER